MNPKEIEIATRRAHKMAPKRIQRMELKGGPFRGERFFFRSLFKTQFRPES
jgi:hypothetical protein